MEAQERQLVLDQMTTSRALLERLTGGLTPPQWTFHETPERWSIAENIEHVITVERRITGLMGKLLQQPGEPEKCVQAAGKDEVVQAGGVNRGVKFVAPEAVRPVGKWSDPAELMAEFGKTREATIDFVRETQGNLREHFIMHMAFGEMDCYQWLILLSRHGARHAAQIEEIKADPAFPARTAATAG